MITSKIRMAAAGVAAACLAVAGLGLLPRGATGEQQSMADITIAPPGRAAPNNEPQPAIKSDQATRGADTAVAVTGKVLMPDGSPAVGAIVEAITGTEEPTISVRTDDAGRFQLQGVFGLACRLHASSADGKQQAMLVVPSAAVRTAFASPVELSLAPALPHEVTVLADGRPVEGAHVVAGGQRFSSSWC